jgi:hypothetical protein
MTAAIYARVAEAMAKDKGRAHRPSMTVVHFQPPVSEPAQAKWV